TVPLMGNGPLVGVFSSHAPTRPNSIGVTEVQVEAVDGLRFSVRGADMFDGTPVLDLKPVPTCKER
ncbi:MAG: TrmO family methyltransferase, partial [Atopobiaceae bacterium]|nr:TrmO family methyltransferase [Atopobiaceae bacterium]